MNKESFCDKAVADIRFRPDRYAVREELMAHLDDQKDALTAAGMPLMEAREQAVAAMGDPEELAKELARVHRSWLGYLWHWSRTAAIWLGFFCVAFLLFAWDGGMFTHLPDFDEVYYLEVGEYTLLKPKVQFRGTACFAQKTYTKQPVRATILRQTKKRGDLSYENSHSAADAGDGSHCHPGVGHPIRRAHGAGSPQRG